MSTKLQTLSEAISEHVQDGDSVLMGACLEPIIPFAGAYEILRQEKKNLTLLAPISDILLDMMIGAGAVQKVVTAWTGNVSAGLGYNYRRAVEKGIPHKIEIEDHSNFTFGLSLLAGAMGVPFLPTKSLLGTDILKSNPKLQVGKSPIGEETLVYVPALNPNVAILGVQRADETGGAHLWGNIGVSQDAALASKKVILLADEIVSKRTIESDPNRVLAPNFKVTSVVHCPAFCHPSPMQGYYKRHHEFFHDYGKETKDETGFKNWLNKWVYSVGSHEEYVALIQEFEELKIKSEVHAEKVNYAHQ
ncbi:CoA transferase subunit A [Bacillus taeanensis]|uniref:CoA transferase subunit A n=1 Tax=Bacillus taeanensis TaxID=273032 RepID=A0A366XZJ5_9BACI|nr:CoA-transferase [Bacillus taeanensis]RBW70199.1 CoA transferase subunit A [Bacillus taeanensis]